LVERQQATIDQQRIIAQKSVVIERRQVRVAARA